jgi:hypothetical protein
MSPGLPAARSTAESPETIERAPQHRARLVTTVHTGRCGSTVLGDLLGQHPDVGWAGELFNPRHEIWQGQASPLAVVEAHRQSRGKVVYGLEIKTWDSRHTGLPLRDMLQALDEAYSLQRILLWRRNTLRTLVSFLVARKRDQWHQLTGARPRLVPVRIDLSQFVCRGIAASLLTHLERVEQEVVYVRGLFGQRPYLELTYEDDIEQQPLQGYAKAAAFLGLGEFTPVQRLSRMNPFRLEAMIENFAEVRSALEGTHFAWMLG